jgi:hypothetical protein
MAYLLLAMLAGLAGVQGQCSGYDCLKVVFPNERV